VTCLLRYRNKRGRRMLVFGRIQVTPASGSRKSRSEGMFTPRESHETTVP
jgi:hypothetical protein